MIGPTKTFVCYIDLETFSSVDLSRSGVAKYTEAEDFEILLMSYAFDDDPVEVWDFTSQGTPPWLEKVLLDPDVLKVAWNISFERTCLNQYLGIYTPPEQWRDAMTLSAMNGLPLSLEAAGEALMLTEKKLDTGKALIRYFCQPCKPTISNGGRTRNLPEHAPEKWQDFIKYCRRDTETERTIYKRLLKFPVPDWERQVEALDARMNESGVMVDVELAESAVYIDDTSKSEHMSELQRLTGLENPNSVSQLKEWLEASGLNCESLNKEAVSEMLSQATDPTTRRVLELRRLIGKTSTKKYQAVLDCACADHRVRGLLQYYGASRTGRWCLTGDHEVLTPTGWVRLDEWNDGNILCWNPNNEMFSFQLASRVSFPYEGEMVCYSSQRCEQVATPDHKMPTLNKAGEWVPKTVEEIGRHRVKIPFTGSADTRRSTDPDKLRVLIMTQADGYYTATGSVRYHFKKQRKIDRCKRLLRRCEIPFVERTYEDRKVILVPARQVPMWLRQFSDKTFGYWLLNESPEILFEELPEWDGYRCGPNSLQYSTCNEKNADVIQACALMAGYSATKITKKRTVENWSTAYYVNIWLNPGRCSEIKPEQMSTIQHNGEVYCASTKTGYFAVRRNGVMWVTGNSGRRLQLQNLAQNHLDAIGEVRELVRQRDIETLEMCYDSIPDVLSQLIRTTLIAKPGHTFLVADYSAIEARVINYLADETWANEAFTNGEDIYCKTASMTFGVPVVKHGINGHLRQRGKVMVLGLGYGMGVSRFEDYAATYGVHFEPGEAERIVSQWRQTSSKIPKFWRDTEKAAKNALKNPGKTFTLPCGIKYRRDADALRCRLLSGRLLSYWAARLDDDGNICFMAQNQTTRKWEKTKTWGGTLVENLCQSVARDCLAVALLRLDEEGFKPLFSIHDEVIVEEPIGGRTWEDVAEVMGRPIDWAPGLLLRGDGYSTPFYLKD